MRNEKKKKNNNDNYLICAKIAISTAMVLGWAKGICAGVTHLQ